MTKYEIVLHPDQKLKKKCLPISEITNEIRSIGMKMLETMYAAPGIGLAAPQVGVLKRMFVMDCSEKNKASEPYICINPEIKWVSERKSVYEEGCLSIPDFYGDIERPSEIRLSCLNEDGESVEYYFDGLEATCVQHEIDHLNGILFIDYLGSMRRQIITTKMKKLKKQNALLSFSGTIGV
ncbi:MAG: peptide deformylase [Paracoccaceae bacterium]|nr:peptide deformylase [Paracoccaceae bacterium]